MTSTRRRLEFFYDFVCPYAFLASLRIEQLAQRSGAELLHVPMLLGGVFRSIGAPDLPMTAMPPAKLKYMARELERWSERAGVTLRPPAGHPRRTVLALRAAIASSDVPRASAALFAAYWLRGRDLELETEVRAALDEAGLDGARAVAGARLGPAKDALRAATDRAVACGVFGAPAFFVTREGESAGELFWGQDRMELVERALGSGAGAGASASASASASAGAGGESAGAGAESTRGERPRVVTFYFDYASPFAYLAATELPRMVASGVTLKLHPILLGGLFRDIGTANVPLFEMPAAKRHYQVEELRRWAELRGVPFKFASHFPMNTVKALRLTLLCPAPKLLALVERIFRALWAEDQDISTDAVLASVLRDVGVEGEALLPRLMEEPAKQLLRDATDHARDRGIFGVPTFVVAEELFWGQDRLDQVQQSLGVPPLAASEKVV